MKLILLGAPGAGKGTQAARLCKELNIPTISTGNMLRAAIKEGTPVGRLAETYMKDGKLVPDEVIIDIIHERVAEDECRNGYMRDGVPRTLRLRLWRRPTSSSTTWFPSRSMMRSSWSV